MQDAQTQPTEKTSTTSTIAISQELLEAGQLALDRHNVDRGERGEKRLTQKAFFELVFTAGLKNYSTTEHGI